MILYLDTSALVKLYVLETGSSAVRALSRRAEAIATSEVAYAESRAGFARLLRDGGTSRRQHERRVMRLNQDWEHYLRVELNPETTRHAGELAEIHALRGFDAIHLASALWLSGRAPQPVLFSAFDQRLQKAAIQAGLKLAPAT